MHQDPHLHQKRLLRDLKGAPLSIIIALIIARKALTNQDLQKWTGYKDKKSIKEGLERLAEYGVVRNLGRYQGWMLAEGMKQLPLPFKMLDEGDFFPLASTTVIELSTEDEQLSTSDADLSTDEGDFFPLPLIKKEITYSSKRSGNSYLPSSKESKGNLSPSKYPQADREPDREILALCAELRIAPPANNWLAGWSWVTAEYLIAHLDKVEDEGQQVGLAIWRIGQQQPQPPLIRCVTCHSKGFMVNGECLRCSGKVKG